MRKLLICFDVDGTLDSSAGPIKVERLHQLKKAGVMVCIVSPSEARPKGHFPEHISGQQRRDNLLAAKKQFPAKICLYVSNNNDQAEAEAAGFTYVDHLSFR